MKRQNQIKRSRTWKRRINLGIYIKHVLWKSFI